MSIHRYLVPFIEAGANFRGHGAGMNNAITPFSFSLTPHFDFYDGSTFLFRLAGVCYLAGGVKGTEMRLFFDTTVPGSVIAYSDTTWPSVLDRVHIERLSDGATFGDDLTAAEFDSMVQHTTSHYDVAGSASRFLMLKGSGDTYTAGTPPTDGDMMLVEISGDFTHVRLAYPFPAWLASTAYEDYHIFAAQETGDFPKLFVPNGSCSGAASFDAFVTLNGGGGFATPNEVGMLGGGVFAQKLMHDFGAATDASGNSMQLKGAQDAVNDIILLNDEPLVYVDNSATGAGTGRSLQDAATSLPGGLANNTPVLIAAGSVVGGTSYPARSLVTVQGGLVGSGGSGGGDGLVSDLVEDIAV